MSDVLYRTKKMEIMDRFLLVDRERAAWYRSCSHMGSGQWLQSVPSIREFQCSSDEFVMILRIRLGGIMQNATESDVPSCCNKPFSNAIAI